MNTLTKFQTDVLIAVAELPRRKAKLMMESPDQFRLILGEQESLISLWEKRQLDALTSQEYLSEGDAPSILPGYGRVNIRYYHLEPAGYAILEAIALREQSIANQ